MGGFRVAYAIGNAEAIQALRQVKASVDFNQYQGILQGAIAALEGPQDGVAQMVQTFRERRDTMVSALQTIGWSVPIPAATMYLWAHLPEAWVSNSIQFCTELVEQTGVALAPGRGFGKAGEGYVRFALVHPPQTLVAAVQNIAQFML
jgi:aspartate/methionine/tyrosine aminotransferase